MRRPTMYLAGPLFSAAERAFNASLKQQLAHIFEVYLPQEDGFLLQDLIRDGVSIPDARRTIFQADCNAIRNSDVFLIILDGRSVDEGAAFEFGLAYSWGKLCVGLQTDPRRLIPQGNNPMIESALDYSFPVVHELISWSERFEKLHDGISPRTGGIPTPLSMRLD